LGEIPSALLGAPAWKLVKVLINLNEADSKELVAFGSLWLNNSLTLEPELPLINGHFRLNLPAYGPKLFYEINPERVVYEDKDIIVYNKEAFRPSQGVPHDAQNNVLAAMERRTGLTLRLPHRLDAATSGLLLLAVTREAASRLGRSFQTGKVFKRYLAVSQGPLPDWKEKTLETIITKESGRYQAKNTGAGLRSVTKFTVLDISQGMVLFLAQPLTGRTHQIRLHLAFMNYPILGDTLYGGEKAQRLMLRASGLSFRHPGTGIQMTLGGPWPEADLT
jgi:RluA family pseudouridine synthase